ncbi:MAG: DUF5694 domain-containing protein [Pseudomonadota bacterium]
MSTKMIAMARRMGVSFCACLSLCVSACVSGASPTAQSSRSSIAEKSNEDIKVMVIGSMHLAGSSADVINVEVGSVLTPTKQNELQQVTEALASFQPTLVVTERVTKAPDYIDPYYADFDNEMLATNPNERVQIAYRLAREAGLDRVVGLDESPSEGEPDYFPFGKVLEHVSVTGQEAEFGRFMGRVEQMIKDETDRIQAMPMAQSLIEVNTGALSSASFYYQFQQFDIGENQPAAELQAYYFMRNAKIVSKLMDVTEPGDRVVIVYGAGHKHWLDHLVTNSPGFELVDPVPFLQTALD